MRNRWYGVTVLAFGVAFGSLAAVLETGTVAEYFLWIAPVVTTLFVSFLATAGYALLRRYSTASTAAWLVAALALFAVSVLVILAGGMEVFRSLEAFSRFGINYLLFAAPVIATAIVVQVAGISRSGHESGTQI